jgi:hypothetical protein
MTTPPRVFIIPILELLTAEIASALLTDDAFSSSTSIREHCLHVCRILRNQSDPVPFSVIGKLFGIDKGAVRPHWQRYKEHRDLLCNHPRNGWLLRTPFSGALSIPEEDLDIRDSVDQVEPRFIGIERGEGF